MLISDKNKLWYAHTHERYVRARTQQITFLASLHILNLYLVMLQQKQKVEQ